MSKMTSVSNPTYLLAPNWNFPVDGPIVLGNVVGDPFRPHRPLTTSDDNAHDNNPKTVVSSLESNWRLELEKIRSTNLNLWTKLFEVARLDAGAQRTRVNSVAFVMSELETVYLRDEPSPEALAALLAREPRVRAILGVRKWGRRGAVYMVSGLKVARGFKVERTASTDRGLRGGAGGEVVPEVSVGAGLELGAQQRRVDGFEASNDIIFAYQLLRIRLKGGPDKPAFEVNEFQSDAALLTDHGEEAGGILEEAEAEADSATLEDLVDTHRGLTVNPDNDQYVWLFPED